MPQAARKIIPKKFYPTNKHSLIHPYKVQIKKEQNIKKKNIDLLTMKLYDKKIIYFKKNKKISISFKKYII